MPQHQPPESELVITASELRSCLDRVALVDVREPEEHAGCRIEGCTLIPLGELTRRAPSELDVESDTVVYCAHGVRSMHAALALKKLGFKKVRSLQGGIEAWLKHHRS